MRSRSSVQNLWSGLGRAADPAGARSGGVEALEWLHRQGKNLESTTNKIFTHVTVNGARQSEQQSAMFATKLSKVGERTLQEAQNLTEHNTNQQHTIRTKTPPFTSKARSCTRMPSAEPLVRAPARPGSSRNPCVRCGGPLQR
jgi:hypothetical protein